MSWWSWPHTYKLQTSSPGLLQAASCRLLLQVKQLQEQARKVLDEARLNAL